MKGETWMRYRIVLQKWGWFYGLDVVYTLRKTRMSGGHEIWNGCCTMIGMVGE